MKPELATRWRALTITLFFTLATARVAQLGGVELQPGATASFELPLAARQAIATGPEAFDLVVTDRDMLGLDGLALARCVRALAPHARVILVTGRFEDLTPELLRAHGIDALLPKPFANPALAALARELRAPRAKLLAAAA